LKLRPLKFLKELVIFFVMLTVVGSIVDIWRGKDIPKAHLPALQGLSLQGQKIDLHAQSKGQPVLVYFWGSWCGVCSFVSPSVDTLADYFSVITVALSSGNSAEVNEYLKVKELKFQVLNDPDYRIGSQWSVQVTPTILVIKDGHIQHIVTGYASLFGMWWRMYFT
jgi:thiol-disulfide isomerase/thioredoxin